MALSWLTAVVFICVPQVRILLAIFVVYVLKDVVHVRIQQSVLHVQVVSIYGLTNV